MRTLNLIAAGIILFVSNSIHAQISVSLNIGTPPSWGPVGYEEADYYYLPDVEAYFDNDRLRYRRGYHGRPQRAINYDNQREHDDQREYDNNYSGGKEGHENKHEHESD